jgi:uncharacterized protein (TIGR03435 family)
MNLPNLVTMAYGIAHDLPLGGPGSAMSSSEDGAPGVSVAEPDNGPTLLQAIQSQPGVKLEPKKTQVEILVMDHVEKVPTEN